MRITQLLLEHKFRFLAIVWTIVITMLSLITIERTPSFVLQLPYKDKLVHFVFYFVFVILWSLGLRQKINNFRFKVLLAAIFYGIIIEVLQYAITEKRTGDFYDALANSIGAFCAFIIFLYSERIFMKQELKIKK